MQERSEPDIPPHGFSRWNLTRYDRAKSPPLKGPSAQNLQFQQPEQMVQTAQAPGIML